MAAESASEDWATEEDGDASTDALEEVISSRSALVDDGAGLPGDEDSQRDRATAASDTALVFSQEEDTTASAPASEDSEFFQRTTEEEEEETGYEAGEDDEQEALDLDEEDEQGEGEGRGEKSEEGEFDSQEGTASDSEAESMTDTEPCELLVETSTAPGSEVVPAGEGEGDERAVVTQRDEEIENYQSTVKELSAALIERGEKIGAHHLEYHT